MVSYMLNEEILNKTKVCNKCKQELNIDQFSNHSGSNYLRPECKKCNNLLSKQRKELRLKIGNPPIDYICPICSRNENQISSGGGKKKSRWVLDHNHKTNTFRGWLCHICNMGVGSFDDDIDRLKKAIEYLENGIQR